MTDLPNAELLMTSFLRQQETVTALLGDNIFTTLPKGFADWPACRVTRFGGNADVDVLLDYPLLQFDIWGGPKITASQAASRIQTALRTRLPWRLDGVGAIGSLLTLGGLRDFPDSTYDPARPRFIFDARVLTRP